MTKYYLAVDIGASSGRLIMDILRMEKWSLKFIVLRMEW